MLLTASDIAKQLRVHRQRVYEWLRLPPEQGGIPHYSFGNTKRVDPNDFEKWLKKQKIKNKE